MYMIGWKKVSEKLNHIEITKKNIKLEELYEDSTQINSISKANK